MNETTYLPIAEVSLTESELAAINGNSRRTWGHEATRTTDAARLYTSVAYRHSVRGDWSAILVHLDGRVERLDRVPAIRLSSQKWSLTQFGVDVRAEGRA